MLPRINRFDTANGSRSYIYLRSEIVSFELLQGRIL